MVDQVQNVVYRITVDSKGLSAELDRVREKIRELKREQGSFAADSARDSDRVASGRRREANATDELSQAASRLAENYRRARGSTDLPFSHGPQTGGSTVSRPPQAAPGSQPNYTGQLNTIISQLARCCEAMKGGGSRSSNSGDRQQVTQPVTPRRSNDPRIQDASDAWEPAHVEESRRNQRAREQADRAAKRAQEQADRAAVRTQERQEREEKAAQAKTEREEKAAKVRADREEAAAKAQADREEKAAQAKADREAQRERTQTARDEKAAQAKTDREAREQQRAQERADREAIRTQERQAREDRRVQEQQQRADRRAAAQQEREDRTDRNRLHSEAIREDRERTREQTRLRTERDRAHGPALEDNRLFDARRQPHFIDQLFARLGQSVQSQGGAHRAPTGGAHRAPGSGGQALSHWLFGNQTGAGQSRLTSWLFGGQGQNQRGVVGRMVGTFNQPGGGGAGGGVLGALGSVFGTGGGQNSPLSGMRSYQRIIAVIFAALVAMIPMIAAATAALGAMLSAFTAAFGAVGIFAIAAVSQVAELQKALKAVYETGAPLTGVREKFAEVGGAFEAMRSAWVTFQIVSEKPVFTVFIKAMNIVTGLLYRLAPLVESVSQGVGMALDELDAGFNGEGFGRFLNFLQEEGPRATVSLTRSLRSLVGGIAELAMSFAPFIDWFLKGFEDMAAGFQEWAASLAHSDTFKQFMAYAMEQGPIVLDTLGDLFMLIIHIGVALAPTGEALMFIIRAFAWLADAIPLDVLKAFGTWLGAIGFAAAARWLGSVTGLTKGFSAALLAGRNAAVGAAGGMTIFGVSTRSAGAAVAAFSKVVGAMLLRFVVITAVFLAISYAIEAFSGDTDDAADATHGLTEAEEELAAALKESNGVLDENVRKVAAVRLEKEGLLAAGEAVGISSDKMVDAYLGKPEEWEKIINTLKARRDEYEKNLKPEGDRGFASDIDNWVAEKVFGEQMYRSDEDQDQLNSMNDKVAAAEKLRGAVSEAAASNQRLKTAIEGTTTSMTAEEKAARELIRQIKIMAEETEEIKAYKAAKEAKQELRDLTEQQADAERTLSRAIADQAVNNARANKAVRDAEDNLAEAQRRAQVAQENITKARDKAARQLEEMRDRLRDVALDEEGASISLERARQNLQEVMNGTGSTDLDRRQAILDLQRAENDYQDTLESGELTRRDAAEAERKGVEGSDEVVQAIRDKTDADKAAKDAEVSLADAIRDRDRALIDSQEAIQDAQRDVDDLKVKVADATTNLEIMMTQAGLTAGSLNTIGTAWTTLQSTLAGKLSTIPLDDFAARAAQVLIMLDAWKRINADPTMSVTEAWNQAEALYYKRVEPAMPGRGGGNKSIARAGGGRIEGPGTGKSDDIPLLGSKGEHMWTSAEVASAGGHTVVEQLRMLALTRGPAGAMAAIQAARASGAGGYDGGSLDPSVLYAGLNARPTSLPSNALAASSVAPSSVTNHAGFQAGGIHIYNPEREPAGDSLYRSVRKLAFEYEK